MTQTRTLQNIRDIVRKCTGKFDQTQMSDQEIDQNINDFYLFDFPEHLRTLKLKTFYTFRTVPNVGQYTVPQIYYSVEGPIYVGGYQVAWHQSPDQFYRIWPEFRFVQTQIATGDGVNATYTFTLSQTPILQGSLTISADSTVQGTATMVLRDLYSADTIPATNNIVDANGNPVGTINYLTGAVTCTFPSVVTTGFSINVQYYPYVASRPRDVMLYTGQLDQIDTFVSATAYQTRQTQQLYFRAVPNDSYEVKMVAYINPVELLTANPNQAPEWNEWWQLLAYGAVCKILAQDGDHEEYQIYRGYMEESKLLAQRRALKQLTNQRIPTAYSNNGGNAAPFPVFPVY